MDHKFQSLQKNSRVRTKLRKTDESRNGPTSQGTWCLKQSAACTKNRTLMFTAKIGWNWAKCRSPLPHFDSGFVVWTELVGFWLRRQNSGKLQQRRVTSIAECFPCSWCLHEVLWSVGSWQRTRNQTKCHTYTQCKHLGRWYLYWHYVAATASADPTSWV